MLKKVRNGDGAIKRIAEKVFLLGIDELYSNPFNFISKILRIREVEEVEKILLCTLGTIIHETLKTLTDLHGKFISNVI
jgi:hypothetical protein